jgi:hypothetical protein
MIRNNNIIHNNVAGRDNTGFPSPAIYISESGGDSRVNTNQKGILTITNNIFTDNWGGVTIYENSDRYCSSNANTSTGYCTMGNPSVANINTCASASLRATAPYITDCRWRAQNVLVTNNTFNLNRANVDPACTAANSCGTNSIISIAACCGYSPYDTLNSGWWVARNIVNSQNNIFSNNTYHGPWTFQSFNQGTSVTWAQWTAGFNEPDSGTGFHVNGQDAGSTMTP